MARTDAELVAALLEVIERDIVPHTRAMVADGNKVFGAAILRKADLIPVVVESNKETENPLWHGEVHAIKRFYELAESDRPAPRDCLFLTTHEPCSMCLSAITWAGFDNFYYLFSHEDSRDAFNIPHDLRILREVFGLDAGAYRPANAFWESFHLPRLAEQAPEAQRGRLLARIEALRGVYAELSQSYQAQKGAHGIPLD